MLKLIDISKDYIAGNTTIKALKGVNLEFARNEFVSIVGPSGCGKTTMLNIVGGLDQYTSGDLIINDVSTKKFKDRDWDTYRNRSIGFVFQSYNLIPHLTVLGNVELALTISGISQSERKQMAKEALEKVGLAEQINKRPNQLSGGQMQRVSIARALVNRPDIILADEPTGALDSVTSVQIMDLLREIASDKLVIMVTHNLELADEYSDRIIRLLDGEVIEDQRLVKEQPVIETPVVEAKKRGRPKKAVEEITPDTVEEALKETSELITDASEAEVAPSEPDTAQNKKPKKQKKHTSMSFFTALNLSLRNLWTKKTRTFLTAFAGSIGIIGIALVLSLSNGFTLYMNDLQQNTLSKMPITISSYGYDLDMMNNFANGSVDKNAGEGNILPSTPSFNPFYKNNITQEYLDYLGGLDDSLHNGVVYNRSQNLNIVGKREFSVGPITMDGYYTSKLLDPQLDITSYIQYISTDTDYLKTQLDLVAGKYPENENEIVVIANSSGRISLMVLYALGWIDIESDKEIKATDLIGVEYKIAANDDYYLQSDAKTFSEPSFWTTVNSENVPDMTTQAHLKNAYDSTKSIPLKVVGVMRVTDSEMAVYSSGVGVFNTIPEKFIEQNMESEIVKAQKAQGVGWNVLTGVPFQKTEMDISKLHPGFTEAEYLQTQLIALGGSTLPSSISIYPKDFSSKNAIVDYLDEYNKNKKEDDQITISDLAAVAVETANQMINSISIVLIIFAAISLVVSSVMIGIITYVSVIERTKEIGVLRSMGARKKDISRLFNAETVSIGFTSGLLGVLIAALLTIPINAIINLIVEGIGSIAVLSPIHALILVVISIALTLVSGFIPSRIAAKKDPVIALRTE